MSRPCVSSGLLGLALWAASNACGQTDWPVSPEQAQERQRASATALGVEPERTVDLCEGVTMALVLVPAGEFAMGAPEDESPLDPDEGPPSVVRIGRPFWLGRYEVTNEQYRCFDSAHESGWIDTHGKDRVGPGVPMNGDTQPVCRISWEAAQRFCAWLGERLGAKVRLPTEAEWEYACRAGTATPWSCSQADLGRCANLADRSLASLKPWAIRDDSLNDGAVASAAVGSYQPNPWGLHDMHGNVAEWTGSAYRPYPYDPTDGRETPGSDEARSVRGGSWDDVPRRARSAFRLSYDPTYPVYNVGFRVVIDP